jgi:PAS domain S-box-containing protein
MLGYTADELRALSLRDFTHPDDVAENAALLRRALDGELDSYQIETRYLHEDGHVVWGRLSAALVRDQDGQPDYFVAHVEDVTPRKVLERERAEQAAQLNRIFEGITDGVTVYDAGGRMLRTNAAARRILGLGEGPPAHADYAELSPADRAALYEAHDDQGRPLTPDDWPLIRVLREQVGPEGEGRDVRLRMLDGRELEVHSSAAPLRDAGGHLVGAVTILHDQTERHKLARTLAEQAAQLQAILDAMVDPLFVYDSAGRLLRANPAAREMFAVGASDTTSPLAERLGPYEIRDAQGRALPHEDWSITRLLRGEVLVGDSAREVLLRLPDGRDALFSFTTGPIRDAQGQLRAIVVIAHDQTERNRLERATQELATQLQATLDAMSDAVFLYSPEGEVLRLNAAAQAFVEANTAFRSVASTDWWEGLQRYRPRRPDGHPFPLEEWPLARVLRGEKLSAAEAHDAVVTDAEGHERVLTYSGGPVRDAVGKLMGYVFVVRDVTERRRLQRESEQARARELALREVNERLATFVALAAHDLRDPVALARRELERAQRQIQLAAAQVRGATAHQHALFVEAARALARMAGNLDRLSSLLRQLLDVARIHEGTFALTRRSVDLVELVGAAVAEQRLLTPHRTIAFELAGTDDAVPTVAGQHTVVMVDADADRVGQVLANYLSNAVRYSPDNQPITVTLRADVADEEPNGAAPAWGAAGTRRETAGAAQSPEETHARQVARVEVRDRGAGIPPEEQQGIWERFQRARSVMEPSGLGLGLYIARMIVQAHEGQVGIESTVGEASTFWLTLPLATEQASA